MTLLQRGPNYSSGSKPQQAAPEWRVKDRQAQADPQGGSHQAANPQGFVHCASSTAELNANSSATLLHPHLQPYPYPYPPHS